MNDMPSNSAAPTAGALIRAERERRGVRIENLAATLKVSPGKLEALEADRHDELPGPAFTRALAQTGIVAWEGIGDVKGKPVDPDRQAIEQLLELWPAFDAIDRLYVGPALTRLDEKNV